MKKSAAHVFSNIVTSLLECQIKFRVLKRSNKTYFTGNCKGNKMMYIVWYDIKGTKLELIHNIFGRYDHPLWSHLFIGYNKINLHSQFQHLPESYL